MQAGITYARAARTVTVITIIIAERYVPKMRANAIIRSRVAAGKGDGRADAFAIRPIISFTFANCDSRRRSSGREAEREREGAGRRDAGALH